MSRVVYWRAIRGRGVRSGALALWFVHDFFRVAIRGKALGALLRYAGSWLFWRSFHFAFETFFVDLREEVAHFFSRLVVHRGSGASNETTPLTTVSSGVIQLLVLELLLERRRGILGLLSERRCHCNNLKKRRYWASLH